MNERIDRDIEGVANGILVRYSTSCAWCKLRPDGRVTVAIIECGSGPGHSVLACPQCLDLFRIIPLDDHPPESFGSEVLYRPYRDR